MLASVKPKLLQYFSTSLDLMIKLVGDLSFRKEGATTLQRVTRMQQSEAATPKEAVVPPGDAFVEAHRNWNNRRNGLQQGEEAVSAATILVDGANPSRDFPLSHFRPGSNTSDWKLCIKWSAITTGIQAMLRRS